MSRRRARDGRHPRNKQRGVALLLVLTWIALMTALVGQFTYGTNVDAAQAANARDELRAHYLAVSSVNLARMLIKIQKQFVDPIMGQAQKLISQAMGGGTTGAGAGGASGSSATASSGFGFSLRVTDYAGPLMGFFSGSKEEVAGLGSLIGIDTTGVKGLGLKSGTFDAEITPEDGKININCGGGFNALADRQKMVYRLLMGLMYSRRFDRLFSESDANGQFATRVDVARAIIDWSDTDEQGFAPDGVSASGEDYRYDDRADKYRAHNDPFDTLEELKLVRGVTDGFMEAFQPHLTVYPFPSQLGGAGTGAAAADACKVNLSSITNKNGGDCTPLLMGVLRAAAIPTDPTKPPADPAVLDDTRLYPVVSVLCDRASAGGFDSLSTITQMLQNPTQAVLPDDPRYKVLQSIPPINVGNLADVAKVGPPRMYRVVAVGEAGKVKKKITAIVDTAGFLSNPLTLNASAEQAAGVLRYWREE
jgi:general secretion pathway protein K